MTLPEEIQNYRKSKIRLSFGKQVPNEIHERWTSRIVPYSFHLMGEHGAEAYLVKFGRNIGEDKLVNLARKAETEGYLDLANGFWKKAHLIHLASHNSTGTKPHSSVKAKTKTAQSVDHYNERPIQFDVFLCHNSSDKPMVRHLAEQLHRRGLVVWLDEWELIPGRPWQEALEEIIQTVMAAAVLVGPDGIGPWQDREMRGFLSEFVRRNLPVIPVLLPGASDKPELPIFLKEFTWVDLRAGISENALDRLQWGITGKKPTG